MRRCRAAFFRHLPRVDSLTQAVLGAAVGELLLGKRMGNRALAWGAFFGTLPDLDVLFSPLLSHSAGLWWHRGPSHSLLVMGLAAWFLGKPLAALWKRDKVSRKLAGWFVFAELFTHVLIDCFTVYGTSLWWPLPMRVALNNFFIVDPLFTLPMLVGIVWIAFLRTKKQLPRRRKINAWAIGISCVYVCFSFGMKSIANKAFEADLTKRGIRPGKRFEAPTPFNIFLWRSVAQVGNDFWVGYHSVFDKAEIPVRWTVYPDGRESIRNLESSTELRRVAWFSDGYWITRPNIKGAWIGDLRFGESRDWNEKRRTVDQRLLFSWQLLPNEREKLRPLHAGRDNMGEQLRRLASRAIGNHEGWEGIPRLDGVTGSLPELLEVRE